VKKRKLWDIQDIFPVAGIEEPQTALTNCTNTN
jgi:hypothetical protein